MDHTLQVKVKENSKIVCHGIQNTGWVRYGNNFFLGRGCNELIIKQSYRHKPINLLVESKENI
jgi:hypothetical protein